MLNVAESERLEFKREAYGRADDDVREFLKDISSMANAAGGFLLIGVDADAENMGPGGRPLKVVDGGEIVQEALT